jgi:potassium/hydrogen antiporter
MPEIANFGFILVLVAGGFAAGVLATRIGDRIPVPAPAIFLVAAALVSDLWPSVYAHVQFKTVERIAVVALIVILFNGGMDIGWRRFRASAGPILSLGIFGTFATAAITTLVAHYGLGFDWRLSGLLGAALAPTDPAVMFSVLGGREIKGRSGTTLEGEAGVNDPAGIALMIGMIELATHDHASFAVVVREFVVEMAVGCAVGVAGAVLLVGVLRRLRLAAEGLYPVFVLMAAALLYGLTSLAHGSGFLAVFIVGLSLSDAGIPVRSEVKAFHTSLAGFAELVVFVALGLTVHLGEISGRIWFEGVVLALVLALVARPLAVLASLVHARLSRAERLFIIWSGLKGAVPILLAAFAVIEGVPGAGRHYAIVFVVVLVSVVGQGSLVSLAARRLGIPMSGR